MSKLSEGDLQHIRKTASAESGRLFLEERFGTLRVSAVQDVLLRKAAAADQDLLKIAAAVRPDDPLAAYEELGGTYNFGTSEG